MIIRPNEMHPLQADCFKSRTIPLCRLKQTRMPTWKFMAAPMLVSAALFMAALSVASAGGTGLNGIVQTGGTSSTQPLPHVHVTLFEATSTQPTVLGEATTDVSGQFSITSQNNTSSSIFYVSAD